MLLSVRDGPLAHPQDTEKLLPVAMHPVVFLTVIVWLPLATPVNIRLVWYEPPSRLYSRPAPVGLVTVIDAFPNPREQSIVCEGFAGGLFGAAIPDPAVLVQPFTVWVTA
jgi:hypothetical protein